MTEEDEDLYALLELDPGATDDEIRRAFKMLTGRFDPGGPVMYGLFSAREGHRLAKALRDAYDTLMDPEKRRSYDRSVYPEGHPSLRRADERVAAAPPRPLPSLPTDPLAVLQLPPGGATEAGQAEWFVSRTTASSSGGKPRLARTPKALTNKFDA